MPTEAEVKTQDDAAAKATADAAAKATADAAAKATADAAAAAGKTPEQVAAEAAKADQVSKDAAKAAADAKAAEDAKAGAPAKYELKVPEGAQVDEMDLKRIEKLAREGNLPNDQAQSMLEATAAVLAEQSAEWRTELEADKVYGGEKLVESEQLANAALDKIAPKGTLYGDGLRRMLKSGVGNNLYVMAALANVGRMTKEDGPVEGAPGGGDKGKKSQAEILYPNSPEFKKP